MRQVLPRAPQLRHAQAPGLERGVDPPPLLAEAPVGRARLHGIVVERRDDVDLELPGRPRLELDPIAHLALLDLPALGEDHLGPRLGRVVLEHELVLLVVEARFAELRERPRAQRVAESEVVVLDREDVREIVAQLER